MQQFEQNNQSFRQKQRTRKGCRRLFWMLFAVVIGGVIVLAMSTIFAPNLLNGVIGKLLGMPVPQTRVISSDPGHFDPFKALTEASNFAAANAQLVSISVYYVRADGTMDLNATYLPAPYAEYKFVEQVAPPSNAPPVGAGGSSSGIWYQPISIRAYHPGQRESITETNGSTKFSFTFVNNGFSRETEDPTSDLSDPIVSPPKCTLAQLWQTAIEKGDAPQNAVAIVQYTADGYDFSISGTSVSLMFDHDCNVQNS